MLYTQISGILPLYTCNICLWWQWPPAARVLDVPQILPYSNLSKGFIYMTGPMGKNLDGYTYHFNAPTKIMLDYIPFYSCTVIASSIYAW